MARAVGERGQAGFSHRAAALLARAATVVAALGLFASACVGERVAGDDAVRPRLLASSPMDGQVDVSPGLEISLTFDEPLGLESLGPQTLQLIGPAGQVDMGVSVVEGGRRIVASPRNRLDGGARYQLFLLGTLSDRAGNRLELTAEALDGVGRPSAGGGAAEIAFTVRRGVFTLFEQNPTFPSDGATEIAYELEEITAVLNDDAEPSSVNPQTVLLPGVPVRVSYEVESRTIRLVPEGRLPEARTLELLLTGGVRSLDGESLSAIDQDGLPTGETLRVRFTTRADPPELIRSSVVAGSLDVAPGLQTFVLGFSEALDPESVSVRSVRVVDRSTGGALPCRVSYQVDPGTPPSEDPNTGELLPGEDPTFEVVLRPEVPLQEAGLYRIDIDASIRDLSGVTLATADRVEFGVLSRPPTIAGVLPASGATDLLVDVLERLEVEFDEALDPSSVGPDAIVLTSPDGPVPGRVGYETVPETGFGRVVFVPNETFLSGVAYDWSLSPALRDPSGVPISGVLAFTFETGTSTDNNPPSAPGAPQVSSDPSRPTILTFSWLAAADDGFGGSPRGLLTGRYRIHRSTLPLPASALRCDETPTEETCETPWDPDGETCCAAAIAGGIEPGRSVTGPNIEVRYGQPFYFAVEAIDDDGNATLGPWSRIVAGPSAELVELDGFGQVQALATFDLDGDARADLLAEGRPDAADGFGVVRLWETTDTGLASSPAATLIGVRPGGRFGASLAAASFGGNVLAPATSLVVGAPSADDAQGFVYVFHIEPGGGLAATTAGDADQIIGGESPGDRFGFSLATGLIDTDFISDLVVGAPGGGAVGQGTVLVYPGVPVSEGPETLAEDRRVRLRDPSGEPSAGAEFGFSVASGVDVESTGSRHDIVVGAPGDDRAGRRSGSASVFLHRSGDFFPNVALPGGEVAEVVGSLRYVGSGPGDAFGYAVHLVPDSNGSGSGEIAIGAPGVGDGGEVDFFAGSDSPSSRPLRTFEGVAGARLGAGLGDAVSVRGLGGAVVLAVGPGAPRPDDLEETRPGHLLLGRGSAGPFYLGLPPRALGIGATPRSLGVLSSAQTANNSPPVIVAPVRLLGDDGDERGALVLWR